MDLPKDQVDPFLSSPEPYDPNSLPQQLADSMDCTLAFTIPIYPTYPTIFNQTYTPQGPTATFVPNVRLDGQPLTMPSQSTHSLDNHHLPNNDTPAAAEVQPTSTAIENAQGTNSALQTTTEESRASGGADMQGDELFENMRGDTPYVSPNSYYDLQVSPAGIEPKKEGDHNADDAENADAADEADEVGSEVSGSIASGGSVSEPSSPAYSNMNTDSDTDWSAINRESPEYSGEDDGDEPPSPGYTPKSPEYTPPSPRPDLPKTIPLEPTTTVRDPRSNVARLHAGLAVNLGLPQYAPAQKTR